MTRTTETKTMSNIISRFRDANQQLVLNPKRFLYFRQLTHDIIRQNTTL